MANAPPAVAEWYARPVLHVSSVENSLRFYVDRLGFTVAWHFEEDPDRASFSSAGSR